ncbi:MAG: hypothetical protein IKS96_00915 [Fibrobacter sp.]|jgi:hypothetical protein|nr:hypothetical protein [Fibrobacter sp.]
MTWTPHENKPMLVRFSEWLVEPDEWPAWVQFFLLPRPLGRENFFYVRVVLLFAMAIFSLQAFFSGYQSWIAQFLHNLNLPVHETGHIVFGIFGKPLITSLGGSLFQVIMPLVFCFALWIKPRDLFGASIALWWAFENLIDVAPYIDDALHMKLTLISGGTGAEAPYGFHDWNFILSETGLLLKYDTIAATVYAVGYIGMALCVLWGSWSLLYYFIYQKKNDGLLD